MVNDENGSSSSSIPTCIQNDFLNPNHPNDDNVAQAVLISASTISGTTTPTVLRRRYDVSAAMDRLRASFAGPVTEDSSSVVGSTTPASHHLNNHCLNIENVIASFNNNNNYGSHENDHIESSAFPISSPSSPNKSSKSNRTLGDRIYQIFHQIPAIILIGMFHLMIGIPFGVSYFPIGWTSTPVQSSAANADCHDDCDTGNFPLLGYVRCRRGI
jgi:hypothetical protein